MADHTPSTKPYLIRALHQWCSDFGFTPFIAVFVDQQVEVPMEFVKNDEIVLNLSTEACHELQLENDWISFQARFSGVPKKYLSLFQMFWLFMPVKMDKGCRFLLR